MADFLDKFNGGELIGLAAVAGSMLVAAISVVATQWRRVRVAELESGLKQQMLDKGMSAADIEQVMRASRDAETPPASTGDEVLDKAALVRKMIEQGYEGEDIANVLRAYQTSPEQGNDKVFAQAGLLER